MGVPVIRCGCEVCRSNDPRDQRTRSSILLQADDATWIVDTGAEFRIQALREQILDLDAVLYTHSHADHIMGFDDLRRFSPTDEKMLPIYAAPETMRNLKKIFSYAFSGEARFPGYVHPDPRLIEGEFSLGGTQIVPVRLEHGLAHVLGFVFRQYDRAIAAYLSDCKRVYPDDFEKLSGIETLIIGTPCRRSHPTHMSLEEGLRLSDELKAKRTYFTHLSHDFGHVQTQKLLPPNRCLAYDGLSLDCDLW